MLSQDISAHRHNDIAPNVTVKELNNELRVQEAAELNRGTKMPSQDHGNPRDVVHHLYKSQRWHGGNKGEEKPRVCNVSARYKGT